MLEVDFSFIERGNIKLKSIFHHKTFLHKKIGIKKPKSNKQKTNSGTCDIENYFQL